MVEARDVTYSYKSDEGEVKQALVGVNADIPTGFTAIIGHNGSGKSTFARMLNALLLPEKGNILVLGMDTRDESLLFEIRKTSGMVFQNPDNQLVATVVEEDIAFGPENIGVPQPEIVSRVNEALEMVGLTGFNKRAPHMLSGGQKQRVAIAGVLALRPKLMVMDEATAMLDPKGRQELMAIAKKLCREGLGVILITHNLEEAALADRVIVMAGGKAIKSGTPCEILTNRELLELAGIRPSYICELSHLLAANGLDIAPALFAEQLAEGIVKAAPSIYEHTIEDKKPAPVRGSELCAEGLNYVYLPGSPFEHHAVCDVSLKIAAGEFVGIAGATGSGKSTLIQMLAGLIKPTGGSVSIDGYDISKKENKKRLRSSVGVVFQYPEQQLFEETIERDIAYGPKRLGVAEEELPARVKVAMELLGLDYEKYKDTSPFELSGGQKRKVAIAGVLAMEPRILILDEPVAGLDPKGRSEFMELMRMLNRCGTTIIMISHSMDDLAEYADRILIMQKGRLVKNGAAAEVFSDREGVRKSGLDLPTCSVVCELLEEKGLELPRSIIKMRELIKALTGKTVRRGGEDA